MIIAVDFDGTLVRDAFPNIGQEIPLAVETLKYAIKNGHQIILHTSRTHCDYEGHDALKEAEEWCARQGIELLATNDNPISRKKYICQTKVYADMYIDDHSFGIPLKDGCVDWKPIMRYFKRLANEKRTASTCDV